MPREPYERKKLLEVIDDLSNKPRLSEVECYLSVEGQTAKVRVGEIDQTSHSANIKPWAFGGRGIPFVRGVHFTDDGDGAIRLHHPAFDKDIPGQAGERQQARWTGPQRPLNDPRLACQAIVNAHQQRRLRWVVMPAGCILGNSVNHIEMPSPMRTRLIEEHGDLNLGLNWLCGHLNDGRLDEWAKAWAANNNVNNYELEMLPLDLMAEELGAISTV